MVIGGRAGLRAWRTAGRALARRRVPCVVCGCPSRVRGCPAAPCVST